MFDLTNISKFFLLGLLLFALPASAQTKVQVITTTIDKSFACKSNDEIKIKGEKANVVIRSWAKPEVKVTLKFISKHTDKATAEKEISFMRYILEKEKGIIHLENYFALPKGTKKVSANLKAEYEIYIPSNVTLDLQNNYGNVDISNVDGAFTLKTDYGKLNLKNTKGSFTISTYFSDLTGENMQGKTEVKSNHSDVVINAISGSLRIQGVYGELSVAPSTGLEKIDLKMSNGDATITLPEGRKYNYELSSSFGDIKMPSSEKICQKLTQDSESKKELICDQPDAGVLLKATTSFGNINIIKK